MTQPPGSLPNNKETSAGEAADFTQSQRCPNCGAHGQDTVCDYCDFDSVENAFVTDIATEENEACPFCGSTYTVPSAVYLHCNMCDSDFDKNGEVVIDDDSDTKPLNIGDDHDEQIDS